MSDHGLPFPLGISRSILRIFPRLEEWFFRSTDILFPFQQQG